MIIYVIIILAKPRHSMSHPFLLFPEFKDQIPDNRITQALDLIESIIAYSKGIRIKSDEINRLQEKIDSRMTGTRLYPGGSNILFGWGFDIEYVGPIIFKPYYC